MKHVWFVAAFASLASCVPAPRPRVLEEVDRARESASAKQAEALAPQAFLAAEKKRREATEAADDEETARAQILAEQAIVAYRRAFALARLAKARERLASAEAELSGTREALADLDAQQLKIAAEADDLEMRIKVARDALPLKPNEPTNPAREQARHEAALAIVTQARLLCAAAKLLSPGDNALAAEFQALDALDEKLSTRPKATPIDAAIGLRSQCLSKLAAARRPAVQKRPATSPGDELLAELSRARLEPHRDDRGVVVTLHRAFEGNQIRATTAATLKTIGQIAREHPESPLLVVAHSSKRPPGAQDTERSKAAARILEEAGAPKVDPRDAGDRQPIVPAGTRGAQTRNERLEVVFVTPGW